MFITLSSLSCGKRKPPVPPTERIPQRTTITGIQQGNRIILSWKMPVRNSSENDTDFINRVDVYRLTEPQTAPEQINEEEFSSRSTLIDSIPVDQNDFALKTFTYSDTLAFSTQPARLRYAIKFVNNSGQKASFSNFLTIQPSPRIAKNPESLSSKVSQDYITISWSKPASNVDGSTPANVLGYNIYRRNFEDTELKKLNDSPISDSNYSDSFFEFGKKYVYLIRSVSVGTEGEPVESVNSPEIEVLPVDTFAPGAPESITVAASPNSISIFFAANPEKDIAGYKIFRSTDQQLDLKNWQILNTEPVNKNTFIDRNVTSGVRYFYYLKAVDNFGNESNPSEIVSEIVP